MANPFRYSSPVTGADMVGRRDDVERLLELADGGHNSRIAGPRRYGKSTLLRALGQRAADVGLVPVYVNFFGVVTARDIAERIELAYADSLTGPVARWFGGVRATLRLGGGPVPGALEIADNRADARAQEPMLERLALPRRLHERHGRRCLIAFDEFQDALTAGTRIDAVIRSEIEHHADAASYVFAGSHLGMMRELFTDRRRAFYAQARALELTPLDPAEVSDFVTRRFLAGGKDPGPALAPLLELGAGHPQRLMLLAHFLWEETPRQGVADGDTWLRARSRVVKLEAAEELRGAWSGLAPGERRAMLAIATGRAPYARSTPRAVGGSRGGGMDHAIRALLDKGDLSEDPRATSGYRVVDPLLAHWIRDGRHAG